MAGRPGRRRFLQGGLAVAGLGVLAGCGVPTTGWPLATKVRRVGYLTVGAPPANRRPRIDHLKDALRDLGWVEGQDIVYEPRYPDKPEGLPAAAEELVRLPSDVIIVAGQQATRAVQAATNTIPIVMTTVGDAHSSGLIANLAHPEGNITGYTQERTETERKAFQLLTECVLGVSRVGLLFNTAQRGPMSWHANLAVFQSTAATLGVEVLPIGTTGSDDYQRAFSAMVEQGAGAVHILPDEIASVNFGPLAQLALGAGLPASSGYREFPFAGGLLALGIDFDEIWRRAAVPVDKLLRGARPGHIPVELPTKFETIVNLQTARTLSLTVPQPFLLQATEVIS